MRSLVNKLWRGAVELVYPPVCVLCLDRGDDGRDLCAGCRDDLPRNFIACPRCAEPMTTRGQLCGHCQQRPPDFDRVHAPFVYDFPVAQMIAALKFNGRHGLAPLLGELLADELEGRVATPDVILPVPLHPKRLRERGYNQALELARPLARRRQTSLDTRALRRDHATEALSHLDRKQRRRVIRGAFQLDPAFNARHVALVDDVVTTGSTVGEITRLLRRAGVERVDVWALARTPEARAVKKSGMDARK